MNPIAISGKDAGELGELITELDQEIATSGLRGKADPKRSQRLTVTIPD